MLDPGTLIQVAYRDMIDHPASRDPSGGPPPPLRLPDRLDPAIFQLPVEKMRAG